MRLSNQIATHFARHDPQKLIREILIATFSFAAITQPSCATKKAGFGSIASIQGITCPTCNKVSRIIFGGEALLRWFVHIRPTVPAFGLILPALSIRTEWRKRRFSPLAVPPLGDL